MSKRLEIVRGTNCSFGVTAYNADGTPLHLLGDTKLVFAVKKNPKDKGRLIVKTTVNSVEEGVFYFELFPSDTLNLPPSKYYYDVSMQQGTGNFFNIIEATEFIIKPNISELGDGA